jgi:hypothetical protein
VAPRRTPRRRPNCSLKRETSPTRKSTTGRCGQEKKKPRHDRRRCVRRRDHARLR